MLCQGMNQGHANRRESFSLYTDISVISNDVKANTETFMTVKWECC